MVPLRAPRTGAPAATHQGRPRGSEVSLQSERKTIQKTSANPYVALIDEFPDTALAKERIGERQGSWREHFVRLMAKKPSSLTVEIGCSNGVFLNDIAAERPDRAFVGLDWKYKLVYKCCEKAKAKGVKNTSFVRGRAQECARIFGEGEVDEVWVFFPDPWPKAAQQKHRIFQEPLLKDLHRILAPGGRIFVKTDHPGYFEWMLAVLGRPFDPAVGELSQRDLSDEKSKRNRQVLHRSYGNKDLPEASAFAAASFELAASSYDFWADKAAGRVLASADAPAFAGKVTLFERLFLKDNLPVYFLQLNKRA